MDVVRPIQACLAHPSVSMHVGKINKAEDNTKQWKHHLSTMSRQTDCLRATMMATIAAVEAMIA